jgi:hypothetical protein
VVIVLVHGLFSLQQLTRSCDDGRALGPGRHRVRSWTASVVRRRIPRTAELSGFIHRLRGSLWIMATEHEREIGMAAIAAIRADLAKLPKLPNPFVGEEVTADTDRELEPA